jgi:hypothetical protein
MSLFQCSKNIQNLERKRRLRSTDKIYSRYYISGIPIWIDQQLDLLLVQKENNCLFKRFGLSN